MSYIKEIEINEAKGFLRKLYNDSILRAGLIWNIVKIMSIHPETMK